MQQMWLCIFLCKRIEDTFRMHSGEKSNKCSQCNYASLYASSLRTHLKTHRGEKSNKCNQCDYACSDTRPLRTHLKTQSGEKPNKCNQCDFGQLKPWNGLQNIQMDPYQKSKDIQRFPWMCRKHYSIDLSLSESKKWGLYGCSVKKADLVKFGEILSIFLQHYDKNKHLRKKTQHMHM